MISKPIGPIMMAPNQTIWVELPNEYTSRTNNWRRAQFVRFIDGRHIEARFMPGQGDSLGTFLMNWDNIRLTEPV